MVEKKRKKNDNSEGVMHSDWLSRASKSKKWQTYLKIFVNIRYFASTIKWHSIVVYKT